MRFTSVCIRQSDLRQQPRRRAACSECALHRQQLPLRLRLHDAQHYLITPLENCNIVALVCRTVNCAGPSLQAREPATSIIVIDILAVFDCADAINNLPGLIEFKR